MPLRKTSLIVLVGAGLLASLACAALGPAAPTATPYPTYTPYPEPTPYPTYTPFPTPSLPEGGGIPARSDEKAFLEVLAEEARGRGFDAYVEPLDVGGGYLRLVTPDDFVILIEYHYDVGDGVNFLHFEAPYGIQAGAPDITGRISDFNANYTLIHVYQQEDTLSFVSTFTFGDSLNIDDFFNFVTTFEDAVLLLSDDFSDVIE